MNKKEAIEYIKTINEKWFMSIYGFKKMISKNFNLNNIQKINLLQRNQKKEKSFIIILNSNFLITLIVSKA